MKNLTPTPEKKDITEIMITEVGRKHSYLAIRKDNAIVPAIYFRKSKWVSETEFEKILQVILTQLLNE